MNNDELCALLVVLFVLFMLFLIYTKESRCAYQCGDPELEGVCAPDGLIYGSYGWIKIEDYERNFGRAEDCRNGWRESLFPD